MPLTAMAGLYVKLFNNGRHPAVRIPREFELPGEDAIIGKEGQRIIIEPGRRTLKNFAIFLRYWTAAAGLMR